MGNAAKMVEFGGVYLNEKEIARKEVRPNSSGKKVYYVWMKNGTHFSYLRK